MMPLNVTRVLDKLADRTRRVTANIHDSKEVAPNLFKVVASFNTINAPREELSAALSDCLRQMGAPVEGSFRQISTSGMPAAVGFVVANRVIREYKEEESANFKVMAANILMDKQDESLWELRQVGNDKYLTRQAEEDLAELIVMAKVRNIGCPSLTQLASAPVSNREFVAYVSAKDSELHHAYVIAADDDQLTVQPVEGEPEEISPEQVVESAYLNGSDKEIAESVGDAANSADKSTMLEYYKKMYSYAPDYYKELKEIINSHSVV